LVLRPYAPRNTVERCARRLHGYFPASSDDPAALYQDILVGLLPEQGINNGEPSLHAKCIDAVSPTAGDVIIHVGAGSGYYTAILAHLAGSTGRVYAYELHQTLAQQATENLKPWPTVTVIPSSAAGAAVPNANVIYVSAGATRVPHEWLDALVVAERIVLPLTPNDRGGFMLLVTRLGQNAFAARSVSTASFIPCIGVRSDSEASALAAALDSRSPAEIRSLRREEPPDGSVWVAGDGWWLSTANP